MRHLLHLLRLFLLRFLLLLLVDLLDLRLVALRALFLLLLFLLVGVRHLLLLALLDVELDGEADELRVLLHEILQAPLLQELRLVLFQVADDLRATLDLAVHKLRVLLHRERAAGAGLPDILFIVVMLADHPHLVRNEVCRVEAHTELPDHGDVAAGRHRLHESLRTRLGNGAKVVDELVFRHADARVLDGDRRVCLVWDDLDEKVRLSLDLLRIGDGLVPDLVQGVGCVGNQLAQEDLLVAVEGVDDQAHQLLNVSVERERLRHGAAADLGLSEVSRLCVGTPPLGCKPACRA
mmetsp:Transcript_85951/g.240539  ORF Transcript_85951/g.240539 Transcript_85951/m.240539 type:complete len:294 (-) Transcript_85951:7-888(-)